MAVLSVKSMMNELFLWIQIVQNLISITTVTCGEDHDFKLSFEEVKKLYSSRPDVDSGLGGLACWKFYSNLDIENGLRVFVAMNESFIQIENNSLEAGALWFNLQLQHFVLNL